MHVSHSYGLYPSFCVCIDSLFMVGKGVRSCYDEGKRTAETLTMDYHRGANVEVVLISFSLFSSFLPLAFCFKRIQDLLLSRPKIFSGYFC